MHPNPHSRGYLPSLDGWRALAVGAVLLDHSQPLPWRFVQHHMQAGGPDGVWLFFAISGLLICSRLLEEEALNGRISLRNFYIRRSFRIFPASFTFLLVILVLGAFRVIPVDHSSWLSALLFCRNYWSYFMGSGNAGAWFTGHFWSLAVEEHFYLFFPALLVFFPRSRRTLLIALSLLCTAWMTIYLHTHPEDTRNLFWNQRTEFCLIGLLVPAICAITLRRDAVKAAATRWLNPAVLLLVCLALVAEQYNLKLFGTAMVAKALLFPLLLLSTILHPGSWLTRLLETAPFRFVGKISYSLYLWQTLFLTRSLVLPGRIHFLQSPLVGTACAVLCALASFYLVETPAIAFGRRFVRGSQTLNRAPNPIAPPA